MLSSSDIRKEAGREPFWGGVYGGEEETVEQFISRLNARFDAETQLLQGKELTFLSSDKPTEIGELTVSFQGHIYGTDYPEETVAELYRSEGNGFPASLEGSYRVAVHDPQKDRLILATDKLGTESVFYRRRPGCFQFASHRTPLVDPRPKISEEYLKQYLVNPTVVVTGGVRGASPFEHVKRLPPASTLHTNLNEVSKEKYWTPYHGPTEDISSEEAVEGFYKRLKSSAEQILSRTDEDIQVLVSGGTDANVTLAMLSELGGDRIKASTFGWEPRHFEPGRRAANLIGANHATVDLDYSLPDAEHMWLHERPNRSSITVPVYRVRPRLDTHFISGGLGAAAIFPHYVKRGQKLDALQRFRPVFRFLDRAGITTPLRKLLKGDPYIVLDTLSSPYASSLAVNKMTMERERVSRFVDFDAYRYGRRMERLWDEQFGLDPHRRISLNYQFTLLYGVTAQGMVNTWNRPTSYLSLYGNGPLMEYAYSLPPNARHGKSIMHSILKKNFSSIYEELVDVGSIDVARVARIYWEENRSAFADTMNRLKERPFIEDSEKFEELVTAEASNPPAGGAYALSLYVLEKWFEAFEDNSTPWKPP